MTTMTATMRTTKGGAVATSPGKKPAKKAPAKKAPAKKAPAKKAPAKKRAKANGNGKPACAARKAAPPAPAEPAADPDKDKALLDAFSQAIAQAVKGAA